MNDVLITGAGPVGLLLAIELVRHGLRPRIIERKKGPARFSRAIAIQPRTLEALEACGVTRELVARGVPVRTLGFRTTSNRFAWSLDDVPGPHPYVTILPQFETEQLLEARARELGILVERGVELVHLQGKDDGVDVILDRGRGGQEMLGVGWVCGCDGGGSTVRRLSGLDVEATDTGVRFVVADVRASFPYRRDESWLHAVEDGLCAVFPMPGGDDRWRVMGDLPPDGDPTEPGLEVVQHLVDRRTDLEVPLTSDGWIATFWAREHVVRDYRAGRVLLVGDAAHTHGPIGGQGMNTGLQDAHNLAWKLADTIRHGAPPAWLDSYDLERRPVAQRVVADTGRAQRLGTAKGAVPEFFRDRVLGFLGGAGAFARDVMTRASEVEVRYPDSPLSHRGPTRADALAPGDHVPDVVIYRELRLRSLLRSPRHVLFLFVGDPAETALQAAAAHRLLPDRLDVHVVPPLGGEGGKDGLADPHGALRDTFGAAPGSAVLVRPDGYLGWCAHPASTASLEAELIRRFGLR